MPVPLHLTQLFSNNAVSLLTAPISETSTQLSVIPGHGALYPQPTGDGSDFFLITLEDQSATVREIIKVTARVGDTLYFSLSDRGLEDTTPRAWSATLGSDTLVDHRITAETLTRAMQKPQASATSGVMCFNQPFTLQGVVGGHTKIQLESQYQTGSTQLYVGGLRQKLGVDYTETAPDELTLNYALTQAMVDEGQHITVDFLSA